MTYAYISWFFPLGFQGIIRLITRTQKEEIDQEGSIMKKLDLWSICVIINSYLVINLSSSNFLITKAPNRRGMSLRPFYLLGHV